jgi:Abnormal spindle-like microcephaly-assoc'd, ASPM-SPD-2-Hydin/Beta-propeller repeat
VTAQFPLRRSLAIEILGNIPSVSNNLPATVGYSQRVGIRVSSRGVRRAQLRRGGLMKKKLFTVASVCLAALGVAALYQHEHNAPSSDSIARKGDDTAVRLRALEAYGKIPLTFEENAGQTDARVKFLARGAGYTVFLTDGDVTLRLIQPSADSAKRAADAVVRLSLAGANAHPVAHAVDQQAGHANYFVGKDPQKWRRNVPEYARVKFDGVYPGIDLVYYGSQGRLESDYIVSPGADPKQIALRVEGSDRVRLNSDGDAVLSTAAGEVSLHQPRAYQQTDAGRTEIAANYTQLSSGTLGIRVGSYDAKLPLVIDPVVGYSTLLGGSSGVSAGAAMTVDATGNAYIVGTTSAPDYPIFNPVQQNRTGTLGNAFVTKIGPTGTFVVFSTYLGGSGQSGKGDSGTGVAVDANGNVYISGTTASTDFPITSTNAYQVVNNGTPLSGFFTKLDPTGGTLLYSTFLGGSGDDSANAIAVDSNGNAYLTGQSTSTNFPVTPATAIQTAGQSGGLAFVTRINPILSGTGSLIYSTLLGGTSSNLGTGIAVDASFSAYITGQTTSTNFPATTSAFQSALKGTAGNAFVARVDTTTANNLLYATYLGGTTTTGSGDTGSAIALGPNSNVFITGNTKATDFPVTSGVLQSAPKNSNKTTFVARLDTTKSNAASLLYSTYLGGSSQDAAAAIAVDSSGNAYVGGVTVSNDFPTLPGAPQFTRTSTNRDIGYVSVLNSTGSALSFSTYYGGNTADAVTGVGLDTASPPNVYIGGLTASPDFPVTNGAVQIAFRAPSAFLAKLSPAAATGVVLSPSTLNFGRLPVGVTTQSLIVTLANLTSSPLSISNVGISGANVADFTLGTSTCTGTIPVKGTCTIAMTFTPSIVGPESATLTITDSDPSSPQTVVLEGTGTAPPPVFLSPATVNFGNQAINSTSTAQTVTLKNNSTATVSNIVVSITGAGASSFAQTSACGTTLATGKTCTISVTFTPTATGAVTATLSVADSDASSPQTATLNGTGTTTTPDFSVAVAPASLSFAAGSTGTSTVTVTGLNSFTTAVALTCTGAPAGTSCTLNPNSVTPTASGVTSTATITTTARTSPTMAIRNGSRPTTGIWNVALTLVALSLMSFVWVARRMGTVRKLAWTFGVLLTLSLTSCSGLPSTGTPAGTYTITITGTSGSLTHTATISLTVS